jgi:alpha-beta hydrolase superfamily lysophospholipase
MQPAIVVVTGAWHVPAHYEGLVKSLKERGFSDTYCPHLPTATTTLPLPSNANLDGDTEHIRSVIQDLTDAGRQVIVLMHSYGGVVGNNSLDGLLWPQRKAKGLDGGVVHVIYMAAFVIPQGTCMNTPFGGENAPVCISICRL